MPDYAMSPSELLNYEQRKSALRSEFAQGKARNLFERSQLDQTYGTSKRDTGLKFKAMRERLPGSTISRGVFNSGINTRALQDFAQSRTNANGDLAQQYQQGVGTLALGNTEIEQRLQMGLQQVDAERLARQAELAAQLRALNAGG